jgi:hypothetical protein
MRLQRALGSFHLKPVYWHFEKWDIFGREGTEDATSSWRVPTRLLNPRRGPHFVKKPLIPLAVLALALNLAGCSTFRLDGHSVAMAVWLGRSQSDLRKEWGPPQSSSPDGKGGLIWVYKGSKTITTEESGYWLDGTYYDTPASSSVFSYRNTFFFDPQGIIYDWKWSNSDGNGEDLGSYVANVRYHAERGDASAARWLGFWYGQGSNGLAQDYAKAMKWDQVAANRGLDDAENNLGICYWKAPGAMDYAKAFYWFEKSAAHGYSEGEFDLGYCYQQGKGVTKDLKKAGYWFRKAALQGNASAKESLEEVESELDQD